MDDTFRTLFIAVVLAFVAAPARAELSYISPAVTSRLERDFGDARAADAAVVLAKSTWTCDMYGVRSKMQVEYDVPLYKFRLGVDADGSLANDGDQPVRSYERRGTELTGAEVNKGLRDELRVTKDGHLVGKLSLPAQKITIAYSVCTGS